MKWLTSSWRVGSVRGTEIRIHFSLLFSLIFLGYFLFRPIDWERKLLLFLWFLGFVLCIFLHEVGHTVAARFVGVEVKSIVIWLLGGFTNLKRESEKPLDRLAVYAAGPAMTLLLMIALATLAFLLVVVFVIVSMVLKVNLSFYWVYLCGRLLLLLAAANLILLVFNLMPTYPLDGGKILHAIMELFFGESNANLITMIVSIPVLLGLIAFGIYAHDYILLFFSIFIALAIGTLNRHTHLWLTLGLNYLIKRGGYYFLQGDFERAVPYYTRDIEREPKQVNHYVARALCFIWMLQREKALADMERALEIAPGNKLVLLLRGDLYALDKDYDSAWDLFARAQKLDPNWALAYIDRGEVLLDRKEYQPALDEFNKAISLHAKIPLCFVMRSKAYFRLGNLEAAHTDQESALRLSEKDSLTRPEFGMQAYEGYVDWAEDFYGRVILKRPRLWYAFQGRADAYRTNGEHDKAIADYNRALEIKPREPHLYLGRGKSYQAKRDMERAAADFRQVYAVTNKLHLRRQAEELLAALQGEINENSFALD